MSGEGAQRAEAHRWFVIAERDMTTAAHCLGAATPLIEPAAYFCQQAAEKLIKGLLVAAAHPFPKTHDLKDLANRAILMYPQLTGRLRELQPLTVWGFAYRYPFEEESAAPSPSEVEVQDAIERLHELRLSIDLLVPREG